MARYIFLRTAWMKHYEGVTDDDKPTGAGWYVEQYQDGGEVYNFHPIGRYHYGYARIQDGRSLHIQKLGARRDDEHIEGITVVLFAKNPETGGQYIVGWYADAKLYRHMQHIQGGDWDGKSYLCKTLTNNSTLVPATERIFEAAANVEGKWKAPGQTNAWYVEDHTDKKYLDELATYINDPDRYIERKRRKTRGGSPWQPDIELRKKIELAAMDKVAEYYRTREYAIIDCHKENYGWDMEAVKGKQTLLLEVKGLSGPYKVVELTHNEYTNAKKYKKDYRICIVADALNKDSQPDIYYYQDGQWVNNNGKCSEMKELTAARFYNNS